MKETLMHRIWYFVTRLIYAAGLRPTPISYFYSYSLESQDQWRTGKR